jgi:hypothetical protein
MGLSILVRNRNVFLAFISVVSAAKLFLSAIAPASFDLKNIIALVVLGHAPLGPWIVLYPPLYNQMIVNSTQLQTWSVTVPPSMNASAQLISLLFRLPIFALDLATAFILYYTVKKMLSVNEARLASILWFANPLSVLAVELLGTPDMIATCLITLAFSLVILNRPTLAGAALGLGVWVKFFPILLLPPLLLYAHMHGFPRRSQASLLCLGLIGLAGYLMWVLPFGSFYLTNYSPVTQPLPFIYGASAVNGSAFVLIFFYCLLGLFAKPKSLLALLLPTLLIYYAVSNPVLQYLTWAMPLMALDIVLVKRSRTLLFAIFNILGFVQCFLTSSAFLTPSNYSLLMIPLWGANLPWYSQAITTLLDNYVSALLLPMISSFFYASVLVYAMDIVRLWFNGISWKSRPT